LYDGHTGKFQFKAEEIFLSERNWRLKLTASRTSFDILKMNSGNLLTKGSFCYDETKHLVLTFLVNLEGFKEYKLAFYEKRKQAYVHQSCPTALVALQPQGQKIQLKR